MADTAFVVAVFFSLDVESLSYTLPAIPTDTNFDSFSKEFINFPFSLRNRDVFSALLGYQVCLNYVYVVSMMTM